VTWPASDDRTYAREIARRLRVRRVALDLTQQEVADRSGVTRNVVSAFERTAMGMDLTRLRWPARALGLPLPELVDEDADALTMALRAGSDPWACSPQALISSGGRVGSRAAPAPSRQRCRRHP
jgi:transcriptional regulator with XRE-family HTH domain